MEVFLAEPYYVTFGYGMSRPSVVCLSSVTLFYPRQRLEFIGNIFAPPDSSGTRRVCFKILCNILGDHAS